MEFEITNGRLRSCNGTDEIVTVPDGVTEIAFHAFYGNSIIKEIYLPDGLQLIKYKAFDCCSSLEKISFPDNVAIELTYASNCPNLNTLIFRGDKYIGYPDGFEKCPLCKHIEISEKGLLCNVSEYNTKREFWQGFSSRVKFFSHEGEQLRTPADIRKVAERESMKKEKERLSKTTNPLQKEFLTAKKWLQKQGINVAEILTEADSETVDKIQFILFEYGKQMEKDPVYHAKTYKTDYVEVSISGNADKIMGSIDEKLVRQVLSKCAPRFNITVMNEDDEEPSSYKVDLINDAFTDDKATVEKKAGKECVDWIKPYPVNLKYLLVYCRYLATSNDVTNLIESAENLMKNWVIPGRTAAIAIRSALLLSETKEAINYLDKYGMLDYYAKMRGTTAAKVRKLITSNTGLKADGSMTFDL